MKLAEEIEIRGAGRRPRLYGWLRKYDDGTCIYAARRKHREIFRGGASCISDAIREGKAGWAIDINTLLKVRAKGAQFICVECQDNGDTYITPIESYFKSGQYRSINYEGIGRGGSQQRVVLLSQFKRASKKLALPEGIISE